MSNHSFQYTRLLAGERLRSTELAAAMNPTDVDAEISQETWLFVTPHDDDLCLGAGLLMQAAVQAGVNVRVLVVTDGCLGYCSLDQQDDIVAIRKAETYDSFETLGVPRSQVEYVDYPDGGLVSYIGRRRDNSEQAIAGYIGLQNAFTYHLRQTQANRVFVPTHTDLHPDHQITHSELMISIFHAAGPIWPELGPALPAAPRVCELAVYCDFAAPPNLEIQGDSDAFEVKLRSIEAYQSQPQIAGLVANTREAGPYEYIRDVDFRLYSPTTYAGLFR